jgi:hypothetical protein
MQHHHNVPAQPGLNSGSEFLSVLSNSPNLILVTLDEFIEARKLTKMATSALDYASLSKLLIIPPIFRRMPKQLSTFCERR